MGAWAWAKMAAAGSGAPSITGAGITGAGVQIVGVPSVRPPSVRDVPVEDSASAGTSAPPPAGQSASGAGTWVAPPPLIPMGDPEGGDPVIPGPPERRPPGLRLRGDRISSGRQPVNGRSVDGRGITGDGPDAASQWEGQTSAPGTSGLPCRSPRGSRPGDITRGHHGRETPAPGAACPIPGLEPGRHARKGPACHGWAARGVIDGSPNVMVQGSAGLCRMAFTRWVTVGFDESAP